MEAGREMDALVAEKVMGLHVCRDYGFRGNHVVVNNLGLIIDEIARYSTDVRAAWLVVEKMRAEWAQAEAKNPDAETGWEFTDCGAAGWRVKITWWHHDGPISEHDIEEDTFPLAVCRAALEVVESH